MTYDIWYMCNPQDKLYINWTDVCVCGSPYSLIQETDFAWIWIDISIFSKMYSCDYKPSWRKVFCLLISRGDTWWVHTGECFRVKQEICFHLTHLNYNNQAYHTPACPCVCSLFFMHQHNKNIQTHFYNRLKKTSKIAWGLHEGFVLFLRLCCVQQRP